MGESSKGQTLRERTEESNLRLWILLRMNRWFLAGVMLVGMFLGIALLSLLDFSPIQLIIDQTGVIRTMFGPFMGSSIITAVTLVVTLNQLVFFPRAGCNRGSTRSYE